MEWGVKSVMSLDAPLIDPGEKYDGIAASHATVNMPVCGHRLRPISDDHNHASATGNSEHRHKITLESAQKEHKYHKRLKRKAQEACRLFAQQSHEARNSQPSPPQLNPYQLHPRHASLLGHVFQHPWAAFFIVVVWLFLGGAYP